MRTKGINTEKQRNEYRPDFGTQEYKEIRTKSMMVSIFSYGTLTKDDEYLKSYRVDLGEKLFNEVFDDFFKYLNKCTVKRGVYTDHEGCTYNTLIEPKTEI